MYRLQQDHPSYYQQNRIFFQLYLEEQIIGRAAFVDEFSDYIYLQTFQIYSSFQGHGHGRNLYAILEDYVRTSTQHRAIQLRSVAEAVPFWHKMGYIQCDSWANQKPESSKSSLANQKPESSPDHHILPMMKQL